MAKYVSMAPPTEIEIMDMFTEVEHDQYIQVEEIPGTVPLTTLQADMLDPLARELARVIRDLIACGELSVSEDGAVCGRIEASD